MADQQLLKEDEESNDASEEVEMLFQDVIDDNGDQNCHHVNVGLNKVNANLSSLNYDEFNDDTLLYASEWNLATEEIFDDEDVLVISTPDNIPDTVQEANPIVQQTTIPDTMAPMISSEDDETNVNSSIMDTQTEETINQSLITGLLDEDETKSDSEREKKVLVDEAEASRLYLTINSAPLYRWSEGMLPTLATKQRSILQHQDHVINHEDDYGSADDDEHEHSSNKTGDDQQSSESSDQDEKKMYLDSVKNGPSFPAINSQVSPSLRLTATVTNSLKSPWIVERLKHLTKAYNDRTTFLIYVWHSLVSVFEPQSITYVCWLAILAFAFSYNAIIILFRAVFPYELASGTNTFFIMDTIFDVIYVLDIVWFKCHLKYIQDGQWIDDVTMIRKHYLHSKTSFVRYLCNRSIRPNCLGNIGLGRILCTNRCYNNQVSYLFRIIHTLWYMVYIIHIGACSYYLCSAYEGFGSTPWTYDNEGNAYLRCFYFAFRTSASIGGRLPKPNNLLERIYMTIIWLLGVFVFAMVIGQIRDIVANAARDQNYYREILNKTSNHMRALNVKQRLQKRVRFWLNFTWDLQKTFNEDEILKVLPLKSRTDISLSVHYQTLARVELFKNIDRSVLRDLVLKLRPILFLPGDYVCKKGDVGHEMYIVSKGKIVVLAVDGTELISLGEGCVFGEIAILNLEGFTRRTADVRSVGYSQLFALRKIDLWETLKNYPEYQTVLKRKVQRILRKKRQQQNKDKSQNGKVKETT
ncbi:cyclic nucleotide gated channel beta 1 [Blomia tropicalis]|nr:cyclic nucleotide gated channel beta 1 [Blomia tropicalis]